MDGGFEPGILNVHHGPFLNAAGVFGEIRDPQEGETAYRDLRYFYGSYAISPRVARPTRLQFWAEESGGGTLITLRFDSLVERRFARTWAILQGIFWRRFPRWMGAALRDPSDRARRAQ